jgi:amino acid permease
MKRSPAARVFAIIGLIIIGLMLIATLLVGIIDFEGRDRVFLAMIFIDIVVPVFIWLFLVILKKKSHVLNHEANVEDADFEDADAIEADSEETAGLETKDEEGN